MNKLPSLSKKWYWAPRTALDNSYLSRKINCYDVQELDPKKKLIATYNSVKEASKSLDITEARVCDIIQNKSRNKTNCLGKVITLR